MQDKQRRDITGKGNLLYADIRIINKESKLVGCIGV